MSNLAHSPVNDQRFKDALSEVRELARTHAAGDRSLAVLAGRLIRWAADGVIDTTKNKHGENVDDASLFYDNYLEGYSKKSADAHSAKGKVVNKSKLRQCVKFGEMTTVDPVTEFDRWMNARKAQITRDPKSVRPEYHAILECVREQLKNSDQALSDEAVQAAVCKPEKEAPEVIDILEGVMKKLERLITGEAGVKDQDQRVIDAHSLIRERVAALMQQEKEAEVRAAALELGWTVNEAGELEKPVAA